MNFQCFSWKNVRIYGQKKAVPKEEVLYRQGEGGKGFYYLETGEVKISITREDGYERIIDYVTPERLVGEQGISSPSYVTTAETVSDSILYYFSKSDFHDLCKHVPEAAEAFSISLITKIRMLVHAKSILSAPVDVQLAHYLLLLYQKYGTPNIVVNKTALSSYLGKSRVTIWKTLKEWENQNIVQLLDHAIILKDIDTLRNYLRCE